MLKIEDLQTYYNNIPALKGVSIEVPEGMVVSIIGANGAGKSTLLKSISGLVQIKTGRILFKEKDISGYPANRVVGAGISQVPEGRQLFAHLTVQDNIDLGAYLYHFKRQYREEIKAKIKEIYEIFPILEKRAKQIAGTLSGGERQGVAIARALHFEAKLVILDEPTIALSVKEVQEVLDFVRELKNKGIAVIFITHNLHHIYAVSDRIFVLAHGKKLADISTKDTTVDELSRIIVRGTMGEKTLKEEGIE